MIYVVGHRNPDLDSVASAYAYACYKNITGSETHKGIVCEEVNSLTKWVFANFQHDLPEYVQSIANHEVILVDHTSSEQRPQGWQNATILEVVDHHHLDLEHITPKNIILKTYGSTATIITELFLKDKLDIHPGLAGILLAAIIDDTLALKSPITTTTDKIMAADLAAIANIGDFTSFVKEIFNKKDTWNSMSASKIVNADIKESHIDGLDIIISQVETMDNSELEKREDELISYMYSLEKLQQSDLRLLMLTDLLKNSCTMLAVGKKVQDLTKIFNTEVIQGQKLLLPNVMSRKKQVLAPILEYYSKK